MVAAGYVEKRDDKRNDRHDDRRDDRRDDGRDSRRDDRRDSSSYRSSHNSGGYRGSRDSGGYRGSSSGGYKSGWRHPRMPDLPLANQLNAPCYLHSFIDPKDNIPKCNHLLKDCRQFLDMQKLNDEMNRAAASQGFPATASGAPALNLPPPPPGGLPAHLQMSNLQQQQPNMAAAVQQQ